jgi:hypothetical protein
LREGEDIMDVEGVVAEKGITEKEIKPVMGKGNMEDSHLVEDRDESIISSEKISNQYFRYRLLLLLVLAHFNELQATTGVIIRNRHLVRGDCEHLNFTWEIAKYSRCSKNLFHFQFYASWPQYLVTVLIRST